MTLRDLPSVRALAEERARAMYESMRTVSARDAESRAPGLPARSYPRPWAELNDDTRAWWTDAALDLLCDLTHPDSRDAVARLVAEKVPNLQAWEVTAGCESGGGRLNMVLRACGMPEVDRWEPDPTPVDALRLIASKVLA